MGHVLFREEDGIDEDGTLPMYDNSYDFYKIVLDTFGREICGTVTGMKDAFAARDEEGYRVLVHGLKGSGASVGAGRLVRLATESNALIKEGRWDEAVKYHRPIIEELERLIKLIPERLEEAAK